jgi:hypothetical protein
MCKAMRLSSYALYLKIKPSKEKHKSIANEAHTADKKALLA